MENKHILQEQLLQFKQGKMDPQEKIKLLEHIRTCDYCANHLAALMEGELTAAPPDLKKKILTAVKKPEIQIAKKVNETSKRMQLLWYSLRVGAATIGALAVLSLAIIFSNNITDVKGRPVDVTSTDTKDNSEGFPLAVKIKKQMNSFTDVIVDFSNNIIPSEVNNHDKKEK